METPGLKAALHVAGAQVNIEHVDDLAAGEFNLGFQHLHDFPAGPRHIMISPRAQLEPAEVRFPYVPERKVRLRSECDFILRKSRAMAPA